MTLTITLSGEEICRAIQTFIESQGYTVRMKPFLSMQIGDRNEGNTYSASIQVESKELKPNAQR